MVPVIRYATRDSIAERRRALLKRTSFDASELRRRREAHLLTSDEQSILRALDDLEYLEHGA
jgi:hypothetical protein